MAKDQNVTVVHPTGRREAGTVAHDRSGSGPTVNVGSRTYSYPTGPSSSIQVIHDGGRSAGKSAKK